MFPAAVLLAMASSTAFPGGELLLPAQCTAPPQLPVGTDTFGGEIRCTEPPLTITVLGGAFSPSPCSPAGDEATPRQRAIRLVLESSVEATLCHRPSRAGDELVVDLGPVALFFQPKGSADVIRVLSIASGFRSKGRP